MRRHNGGHVGRRLWARDWLNPYARAPEIDENAILARELRSNRKMTSSIATVRKRVLKATSNVSSRLKTAKQKVRTLIRTLVLKRLVSI